MMNAETQKSFDSVQVGDILVGVMSYSMTFHHFYEVVGKTKCSLKIQRLGQYTLSGPQYATPVKPMIGKRVGQVLTRRVSDCGSMFENGQYSTWISIDNKYDPNKSYEDNYMD